MDLQKCAVPPPQYDKNLGIFRGLKKSGDFSEFKKHLLFSKNFFLVETIGGRDQQNQIDFLAAASSAPRILRCTLCSSLSAPLTIWSVWKKQTSPILPHPILLNTPYFTELAK